MKNEIGKYSFTVHFNLKDFYWFFLTGTKQQYLNALIDSGNKPRKQSTVQILCQSITGVISLNRRKKTNVTNAGLIPNFLCYCHILKVLWREWEWLRQQCLSLSRHWDQTGGARTLRQHRWLAGASLCLPGCGLAGTAATIRALRLPSRSSGYPSKDSHPPS